MAYTGTFKVRVKLMNNITKWLYSVILGSIATFFGQYGLFMILVAVAVVFDVITGLVTVLLRAGVELGVDMPFALIICAYIILTESISISENLLAINPDIMPKWIIKLLRGSKDKIDKDD